MHVLGKLTLTLSITLTLTLTLPLTLTLTLTLNLTLDVYSIESSIDAPHEIDHFLDSVKIIQPKSCRDLLEVVDGLQTLVIQEGIKLIVLDSIAALARLVLGLVLGLGLV
jgi:RecA/RadA recombinase